VLGYAFEETDLAWFCFPLLISHTYSHHVVHIAFTAEKSPTIHIMYF
jgi:hypothetical protein